MLRRTHHLALVSIAATFLLLLCLPHGVGAQTATGAFAAMPIFDARGLASVVFMGGTVEQLESASLTSGANGAWAQDGSGAFQLLVVGGPAFLKDGFKVKFVGGFGVTAITLTRPQTSPTPPPVNVTPARVNVGRSGSGADVAITPDGTRALVTSNQTAGTVSVISLADYTTIAVIPVSPFPAAIAISADGSKALVNHGNRITIINVSTNTVEDVQTNSCLATGGSLAVSQDGTRGVAPMTGFWDNKKPNFCTRGTLATVSTSPTVLQEGADLVLGGTEVPSAVAITADGRTALVTLGVAASTMRRVDIASSTASLIGSVGATYGVTIVPNGSEALIVSDAAIRRLSLASNQVTASITFRPGFGPSTQPHAVAVTADGKLAVAVGTNMFGTMALTANAFNATSTDGGDNVAITPDGKRALVTTVYGYMRVIPLP